MPGVGRQVREQIELGVGEHDVAVRAGHPALRGVDDEVAEDQAPVGGLVVAAQLPGPAQMGADPGEQLAGAERLGDVVVGADLETEDDVDLVVLGAEDDHRHPVPRPADLAADVESRLIREHDIEHHYIRVEDLEAGERLAGALSLLDGVALALAGEAYSPADQRVVIDHEHPYLLSIHTNSSK